ncbi:C4-dicarboxylate ABC transporter [Pusillimonas sp. T2]|uniref:TRAP transporter substrate-binding protein n=1 Tax=Pusillimonas sp. T2 TaxID=1548123 RepID=UPI000B9CA5F2|nr:TRAP transporter substrate-binding protein [Pusillimonas sp. T2]OXR47957.1 C4-dicarboxylate ABC transporter [Pusillimonas sp. T2]
MKKLIIALSALMSLSVAGQSIAEVVTLRLHNHLPPKALAQVDVITPWIEKVERESGGKIKIQVYPSMQLGGSPAQLMDQVKDGVVDMTWVNIGYTPGRYPASEVFELPFMIKSAEGASKALWEYFETNKLADSEYRPWKIIGLNVHDAGQIHMVNSPITSVDDFKGKKLRAPSRVTTKMIESLGATAIGMPITQVGESLSKGVVEGAILPWEIVPAIRAHEMVGYHTEIDAENKALYTAVFVFAMNKQKYQSLPQELKKVIDENSGFAYASLAGKAWDRSVPKARQLALDRGNKFNKIEGPELDKWKAAAEKVSNDWVEEVNKKGINGKELIESANQLLIKYDN